MDQLTCDSHALQDPCGSMPMARKMAGNVIVRPALPRDTATIQAYVQGLSAVARHNRFLGAVNELPASELNRMTHMHHGSHPALIAETVVEGVRTMIGEARYAGSPDGRTCEFAVSVADAWRRKRLGMLLIGVVECRAKALGLRYLAGDVLRSNLAMTALARKSDFAMTEPIADARLVRITKDLFLRDAAQPCNEHASQCWLLAA
jgi:GNAT superfamily N-acetyltransferase